MPSSRHFFTLPLFLHVFRNVKQYPDAQIIPGILAFRIGESHMHMGFIPAVVHSPVITRHPRLPYW